MYETNCHLLWDQPPRQESLPRSKAGSSEIRDTGKSSAFATPPRRRHVRVRDVLHFAIVCALLVLKHWKLTSPFPICHPHQRRMFTVSRSLQCRYITRMLVDYRSVCDLIRAESQNEQTQKWLHPIW